METLQGVLSVHPFFNEMPEKHIETVTGCVANVRFKGGDLIFHEGEEANHFYLIREGTAPAESAIDREALIGHDAIPAGIFRGSAAYVTILEV